MFHVSSRFVRRSARHVLLGTCGVLIISLVVFWSDVTGDNNILDLGSRAEYLGPSSTVGISLGSAYTGYLFLAFALLMGPWKIFRGVHNPISTYVRRDFGIWAAVFATLHTIVALQIYPEVSFWNFFLFQANDNSVASIRLDNFGIANYLGLISTVVLLFLLCLSSNYALKALQAKRWKALQRCVYLGATVALFHGIIYMIGDQRTAGFVSVFLVISVSMLVGQLWGFVITKRRANALTQSSIT